MVNMGRAQVRVLADGWTVVTADGKPSRTSSTPSSSPREGPEILTYVPDKVSAGRK